MNKKVLQICHGYKAPFLDVCRQYTSLFDKVDLKITTVFLTGNEDEDIRESSGSDKVIFQPLTAHADPRYKHICLSCKKTLFRSKSIMS